MTTLRCVWCGLAPAAEDPGGPAFTPTVHTFVPIREVPAGVLVECCEEGDHEACVELDRRGIEMPVLEPDRAALPRLVLS